jgi:DNA-directed RNA polymerase specialized sigma24 family protein
MRKREDRNSGGESLHEHVERCRAAASPDDDVWQRIYRTALGIARAEFHFDVAEAEEIGQEVALRAFRHARSRSINFSWLRAGTRFLCVDRRRALDAQQRAIARYGSDLTITHSASARGMEAGTVLVPALAGLPRPCRELIHSYFFAGMTWAEIDAALQSGHRCSQYRMKRCMAALRRRVEAQEAMSKAVSVS